MLFFFFSYTVATLQQTLNPVLLTVSNHPEVTIPHCYQMHKQHTDPNIFFFTKHKKPLHLITAVACRAHASISHCGERDSVSTLAGLLPGPPIEENAPFCRHTLKLSGKQRQYIPTINPSLSLSHPDTQPVRWRENNHTNFSNIVHPCNWCLEPPRIQTMQENLLLPGKSREQNHNAIKNK